MSSCVHERNPPGVGCAARVDQGGGGDADNHTHEACSDRTAAVAPSDLDKAKIAVLKWQGDMERWAEYESTALMGDAKRGNVPMEMATVWERLLDDLKQVDTQDPDNVHTP
ncbi:hypothetical protein NDU88_005129 [Pleurodeles waltl]|uniref:Uncharacterized protein n=1 Tax=Pleurodeles waltl TaxID=8319 RepID=A0AAV7MIH1_PLEWA|nr:hypothetical protein NDU88_005129 [Pleurodeles waltl]